VSVCLPVCLFVTSMSCAETDEPIKMPFGVSVGTHRTHGTTATPDTTKLSCLRRARFGGVNWIPDNSILSPTENLKSEHVQSDRPIHTDIPDTIQDRLVVSGVAV